MGQAVLRAYKFVVTVGCERIDRLECAEADLKNQWFISLN